MAPTAMTMSGPSPLPQFGSVFGWDGTTGHFSLAASNMFRPSLPTNHIPTLLPTSTGSTGTETEHT